jgi:hypothetical protein
MGEWTRIVFPACDTCGHRATWSHPSGGLRCHTCQRPLGVAPDPTVSIPLVAPWAVRGARQLGLFEFMDNRLPERFWDKAMPCPMSGCWLWVGSTRRGYGQAWSGDTVSPAHRYAYEAAHGALPSGTVLDHLCRIRCCVNPAHLEPVSDRVNVRRGNSPSAVNARKTHCKYGHALTPDNTYVWPSGRACKTCKQSQNSRRSGLIRELAGRGR